MPGAGGPLAVRVGEEGGGARHEQAHVGGRCGRQAGVVEEARVERGHPHHRGGLRHQAQRLVGVEAGHQDHRAAVAERDVGGDEQAVGVEHGQRVEEAVGRGEAPECGEGFRVGDQVAMGEHGALGTARGARGIEQRGEVGVAAGDCGRQGRGSVRGLGEGAIPGRAQGGEGSATARRHGSARVGVGRVGEEQPRAAVGHKVVEFRGRVGRVEREEDRARHHAGGVKGQRVGRFRHLCRDAVARGDAERRERGRHPRRAVEKARMGERAAIGQDQERGRLPGVGREEAVEGGVRHVAGLVRGRGEGGGRCPREGWRGALPPGAACAALPPGYLQHVEDERGKAWGSMRHR